MLLKGQLRSPTIGRDIVPVDQPSYPFIILVGPSSSGKSYLLNKIEKEFGSDKVYVGLHYTTHPVPFCEEDFRKSYFISNSTFLEMVKNDEFLTIARNLGQNFGFSKQLMQMLEAVFMEFHHKPCGLLEKLMMLLSRLSIFHHASNFLNCHLYVFFSKITQIEYVNRTKLEHNYDLDQYMRSIIHCLANDCAFVISGPSLSYKLPDDNVSPRGMYIGSLFSANSSYDDFDYLSLVPVFEYNPRKQREENIIFYGVVTFLLLEYLWELFLAIRQHSVYKSAEKVPGELKDIINEETYTKARVYGLDKSSFSIFKEFFSIAITTVLILANGFPFAWRLSGDVVESLGYSSSNEIIRSAAFMLILNIFSTIHTLPFTVYHTFVLEEKHGFNKQTVGFFIKDKIKAFVVGQVIMLPITSGVVYIVRIGGDYFFIYLWMFAMVMTFLLLTIYPNCIAPLFDKYTPLPDGELKSEIEKLAASIEFPLYKLYVVEGSKRSTHSNAYFYGFFKNKRIVLFDTLLKDYVPENAPAAEVPESEEKKGCNNDEVLAVLAHELGHWKLNHVLKNIVIMQ
ncbi:hypothetical protein L9F63_020625, partial [Diploptera punctata]